MSRSTPHGFIAALRLCIGALLVLALSALTTLASVTPAGATTSSAGSATGARHAQPPAQKAHPASSLERRLRANPNLTVGNTNCGDMSLSPSTAAYGGEGLALNMNWTANTGTSGCQMLDNSCPTFFGDCDAGYWVVGLFCSTLAAQDPANATNDCDLNNIVVFTDDSSGPNNSGSSGTSYNTCTFVQTLGNIFGGLPGTINCVTDNSAGDGWSEYWPTGSTSGTAYGPFEQTGTGTPFSPGNSSVTCPPSAANIAAGAIPHACAFVIIPVTFLYVCGFDVCVPNVGDPNDGVSLQTSDFLATFFQYAYAPSFTSGATTTVQAGTSLDFQISTDASPAASVTASGTLPAGVSFVQQGGGTAVLSGTPSLDSAGTYLLTLTAGNGVAPDSVQQFSIVVLPPPPEVSVLSPTSGPAAGGTTVYVGGAYLAGTTAVSFGTSPATSFQQVGPDEVAAVTPAGSGTVDVSLTTPYGSIDVPGAFTYIPQPTIDNGGLSPASGPAAGGTSVIVTGTDLNGTTQVDFGTTAATSITQVSATEVIAVTPGGTGTVPVTLTTPGGTATAPNDFTYIAAPTINSTGGLVPAAGPLSGGTPVTITGTNLAGTSSVTFGRNAATNVSVVSPQVVTAISPAGTGSVTVTVTTPGGTAASPTQFSYVPAPSGLKLAPDVGSAGGGTKVTITGINVSGATEVRFGSGTATALTQLGASSISVISPPGTGSVAVSLTTPGGTSVAAPEFTYVAGPAIRKLSPAQGPTAGGTAVTIVGSGLSGTTAVDFGSVAARFTGVTAGSLVAYAPPGSGRVAVVVHTPGGTATAQYSYLGSPAISSIAPVSGPATGGTRVTIAGTGLAGARGVSFGGRAGTHVSSTATSLTVLAPSGTGTVEVTVITPGGNAVSPVEFTYVPAPVLTGITPSTGPSTGGTTVKLNGKNLSVVTAVHFGTVAAKFGFVTADALYAIAPAGSGTVALSVTTTGGTATSPVKYTYTPLPPTPRPPRYWHAQVGHIVAGSGF